MNQNRKLVKSLLNAKNKHKNIYIGMFSYTLKVQHVLLLPIYLKRKSRLK